MNKIVISDCDGCLTDGKFIYTADGKIAKVFGAHDNDGVKMLKKAGYEVVFITADKRGYDITKKRIDDMRCPLYLVSEEERETWIANTIKQYDWSAFFGDGLSDIPAGKLVNLFVCPQIARPEVKNCSHYTTPSIGGEGAYLEFAQFILNMYNK